MQRMVFILIILAFNCGALFAQTTNRLAPGAPGHDAHWPSAAKQGFGTANTTRSKIWFTLADGVMTEVYYPTLDAPNVQMLQLIIVDGSSVQTEAEDTIHHTEVLGSRSLSFRQVNVARSGNYKITKTYTTYPRRNTVLIDVKFESRSPAYVYVYYDPSLNNSGMHDTGWTEDDALLVVDSDKVSALISNTRFAPVHELIRDTPTVAYSAEQRLSSGYLGTSDGLTELRRNRSGPALYTRAENGNVVQVAALKGFQDWSSPLVKHCTLALGFGKTPGEALRNARASLAKGFDAIRREYESGWHNYVATLPTVESKYQRQFNMAAMVLKALEDKTYRGAFIASPSIPWGGGPNANAATVSGYHAVWSRDLYHVATAFFAMGDQATANRALDYLFRIQQKPDGSFPQNSWVDRRPIGGGLQMDQVA